MIDPENDPRARDPRDLIVVRLTEPIPAGNDLLAVARTSGFDGLAALLEQNREVKTARVIRSIGPKRLLSLEQRARDNDFPPLHSMTSYWYLDCGAVRNRIPRLLTQLRRLKEVGLAYRELPVGNPSTVSNPELNPQYSAQGYLGAAPAGIGVLSGWLVTDGTGVGFADVEKAWCAGHEDLFPVVPRTCTDTGPGVVRVYGDNLPGCYRDAGHHGTSVLGIVVGQNNGKGGIGIAPKAGPVRLACRVKAGPGADACIGATEWNVADAIAALLVGPNQLTAGDVLLLEVQRNRASDVAPEWLPTEFANTDFTMIRLMSALGFVVIEAAANGAFDAATSTFTGIDLNGVAGFGSASASSGAILVGAGHAAVVAGAHEHMPASNFGPRVDCYAWGESVATAGAALGVNAPDKTVAYTTTFGGTSAAAAIVAGVAILAQGAYKAANPGRRLSPATMRSILRDWTFGTRCSDPVARNIGSMPDLAKVLPRIGVVPDLYIRDDVGDDGTVPSAGAVSASPDVVVRPTAMAPAAAFGLGGSTVTAGQENFVYVRVSNRTANAAAGAGVTVFYALPSTLLTPNDWTRINAVPATVDVPGSQTLVPAPVIPWPEPLPPPGHYCFIATVTHPNDPEPLTWPPPPLTFSWDEFVSYIRNNNNVTWKNFNVVALGEAGGAMSFAVAGAPDAKRVFDLELLRSPPRGIELEWELPVVLLRELDFDFSKVETKGTRAKVLVPPMAALRFRDVALVKSAKHRCRFRVRPLSGLEREPVTLAVRQIWRGTEVGRITWRLRAG